MLQLKKKTYQSDDLFLGHLVLFKFAQKAPHFKSIAAEQVREASEHSHHPFALDTVVNFEKAERLIHLFFELDREQFREVESEFDRFWFLDTVLRQQLEHTLDVRL